MKNAVFKKQYTKEILQKLKANIKLEEVVEKDFRLEKLGNAKTEKVYRIIIIVLFAIEVVLILLFATHLIKRKK